MSLLARFGVRVGGGLGRTRIGAATVIHETGDVTAPARVLATSLPDDPEHELVVADLPAEAPVDVWKAFVAALPRGRRPLCVVPGRAPREIAPQVGQWLADQTRRAVLAPHGTVHHGPGWLFAHSVWHSGWVSFRRGAQPVWRGKRFPRPAWDSVEVGRVSAAGFRAVAEPLPAGVWLRPDVAEDVLVGARARLTRTLPILPDALTIVVGMPDAANVELSDIVAYWRTLPPSTAAAARFVRYGEVTPPTGATFGQALADALGTQVCCYAGMPSGSPAAPDVLTLRPNGSLGWATFAQAFAHHPRGAGAARPCLYRSPVAGLGEAAPGVYWLVPGVVLEVVAAGLWIRPADQLADPAGVRTTPLDPTHNLLVFEATDQADSHRFRQLAQTLMNNLDDTTRVATRLMPSTVLAGPPRAPRTPPDAPIGPVTWELPVVPVRSDVPAASDTPYVPNNSDTSGTSEEAGEETDLPWLSRLMETMTVPVPSLPFEAEGS